jgi:hypothetical protein
MPASENAHNKIKTKPEGRNFLVIIYELITMIRDSTTLTTTTNSCFSLYARTIFFAFIPFESNRVKTKNDPSPHRDE